MTHHQGGGPVDPPDDVAARYRTYGPPGATEAVWTATTISLLDELLGFEPGQGPLVDESAFAPTRRHEGLCRACGQRVEMSFEHFPPKTMGNKTKVRRAPASAAIESDTPLAFPRADSYQIQRGSGATVFCEECNSHFGSYYVPALAAFAGVVTGRFKEHVDTFGWGPGGLELSLDDWEVGDIARAGLASVVAQGVHDRLLRRHPGLTDVLRQGATSLPAGLRLGLTFIVDGGVRATPPHAVSSPRGECVFMEMAAAPLAWTLSFMGAGRVALDRTADVSSWLDTPPGIRSGPIRLVLPVGSCVSPLSGDFRTREELEAEIAANTPS